MSIKFTFQQQSASPPSEQVQRMHVILGVSTAKAFVLVASPHIYKTIGIVQFGIEYGLLAVSREGNYVRINGSQVEPLNKRDVESAIYRAKKVGRGESYSDSRAAELSATPPAAPSATPLSTPPAAPTVVLKRHRKIDPELAANNSQLQPLAA
jgi:hypothetical protein